MCNASQKLIEQGISQGLAQGISQGVSQLAKAIEDVRQYHYSFNELIEKGYTEEVAEAAIRLAQ